MLFNFLFLYWEQFVLIKDNDFYFISEKFKKKHENLWTLAVNLTRR